MGFFEFSKKILIAFLYFSLLSVQFEWNIEVETLFEATEISFP